MDATTHTATCSNPVIERLIAWANSNESIRAMLLYSSRTDPTSPVDRFSDYDVLISVPDVETVVRFHEDESWLGDFGKVMVVFRNPVALEHGFESFGFITHYVDGVKIDYSIFPAAFLKWQAQQPKLIDDFDLGFEVLLDKDGLTTGLPAPTGMAYITSAPSEREYCEAVDAFFNDACYVAKCLQRDDLFLAKECLDHYMKFEYLRYMLEWQVKANHNWAIRTGAYGKRLKRSVDPATWAELEQTYTGAGYEENWQALFKTITLFRRLAQEFGAQMGYTYPIETDQMVVAHLCRVREGKV